MEIVITGAGGYIGQKLTERFRSESHECIPVKREFLNGRVEKISELLAGTDIVINLAGAPVFQRWTFRNKEEIYNSRVLTSQKLCSAIHLLPAAKRPKTFISISAVGIYKAGETHDESSIRFDNSFTGKLVQDWESASASLPVDVRRIIFRTGMVIGKDSKTIQQLLPVFKAGLGGKTGNGKQAFPFIHIDDVVSAFSWAINSPKTEGIFNLVAPQTITNKKFTDQLAKELNKPAFFTIPSFLLRLIFGKASQLITKSPVVIPRQLLQCGFVFTKPAIEEALHNIGNPDQ